MSVMVERNDRRAWVAVLVWLALQLTLTSLPGDMLPASPSFPVRIDRVAHFCLYFGLAVLVTRAWLAEGRAAESLVFVWLALGLLGVADELHQLFVPGREAELGDWIMDLVGGGCGFMAGTFILRTRWAARLLR